MTTKWKVHEYYNEKGLHFGITNGEISINALSTMFDEDEKFTYIRLNNIANRLNACNVEFTLVDNRMQESLKERAKVITELNNKLTSVETELEKLKTN